MRATRALLGSDDLTVRKAAKVLETATIPHVRQCMYDPPTINVQKHTNNGTSS